MSAPSAANWVPMPVLLSWRVICMALVRPGVRPATTSLRSCSWSQESNPSSMAQRSLGCASNCLAVDLGAGGRLVCPHDRLHVHAWDEPPSVEHGTPRVGGRYDYI